LVLKSGAGNRFVFNLAQAYRRSILVNTSFNARGKPVVCAPRDAIECFLTSPLMRWSLTLFTGKKTAATASVSHDKAHSLTTIAAT
jgi:hypothetical protein